ncbi:MAG: hypothetical protein JWL85_1010 [Candidatus Saccharibacteria bacterium]|nr:hypothetical protein [Candidatus Saccharibacteria bacterium]
MNSWRAIKLCARKSQRQAVARSKSWAKALLLPVLLLGFMAPVLLPATPAQAQGINQSTQTALTTFAQSNSADAKSCESEGGEMSWILCPVLRGLDAIIGGLDRQITNLLSVPDPYLDTSTQGGQKLKETWARLRNIAYALLVPIMLVMVISTALGFDFISAYTVKKSLPRLMIAAMFITLSWEIATFMVRFINDIGLGIIGLMTSSFGGIENISLSSLFAPNQTQGGAALFATLLAAGGAAAILDIGVILSFAFVTGIVLIIAFLLLAFRQILIIALLILAPLAILSWIFPGNDKLWKVWWNAFSKLLLLFPLIMVLIAGGRIFAQIVEGVDTGPTGTLLKIIAYIAPYFFIPTAFKLAGGAFATIAGIANDRSRGIFDRQKKFRQGRTAKNVADFKNGSRFQDRFGTKTFNRVGQGIGVGTKGHFGLGARGRGAIDMRTRGAGAEAQKDAMMQQLQFDDDGIMAMALGGGSAAQAKATLTDMRNKGVLKWDDTRMNKAVATANAVGFNRQNSVAAMDLMARNKSFSLSGGPKSMEYVIGAANNLAGGNKQLADNMLGSFEFNSRQAGRFDLGHHNYKTGGTDMNGAWNKASLSQHASGTGASLESFANETREQFFKGDNPEDRKQAAIRLLEMQNMLPYATGANQQIINKVMADTGVSFKPKSVSGSGSGVVISVEEQLAEKMRGMGIETTSSALRGRARVYDQQDPAFRTQQATGEPTVGGGAAGP